MKPERRINGIAIFVAALALAGYFAVSPVHMSDFRAFYCAGKAVSVHADPYRESSIHQCERDSSAPGIPTDVDDVTVPAPLPGYALAPFAALASVPFGPSALLWLGMSVAAVGITIVLLRRLLPLRMSTIAIVTMFPVVIVAIPLGQTTPFVGLAIVVCADALERERPRIAALAAIFTAFDPLVALALCATLILFRPATRLTIFAGVVALGVLSVLVLGIDTNLEYVRSVVPAHALGNMAERSQFSTTHFAWSAGLSAGAAMLLGKVWYIVATAAGIWVARRLSFTHGPVALALVPPAFAVFGGPYVHFSQIALAGPAFLLATRPVPGERSWFGVAMFVGAVPWLALPAFPVFAPALVPIAIAYARNDAQPWGGTRLGLSCAGLLVGLFVVALVSFGKAPLPYHATVAADALVEADWSRYVAWRDPFPNRTFLLLQLPTILAFTANLAGLVRRSLRPVALSPAANLLASR